MFDEIVTLKIEVPVSVCRDELLACETMHTSRVFGVETVLSA